MLRVILETAHFMKYAQFCSFHEMRSKIAHFMEQPNLLPISWNEQHFVAHFTKYAIENLRVKRLNASLLISWNGQIESDKHPQLLTKFAMFTMWLFVWLWLRLSWCVFTHVLLCTANVWMQICSFYEIRMCFWVLLLRNSLSFFSFCIE